MTVVVERRVIGKIRTDPGELDLSTEDADGDDGHRSNTQQSTPGPTPHPGSLAVEDR